VVARRLLVRVRHATRRSDRSGRGLASLGRSHLRDHEHRFDEAITAVHNGTVNSSAMMPARFTLDGHEEDPGAIGALTLLLSGASLSAEG
jgi:hypothetical protein